ncbi:MAG: NUDIX domain-containing protein [bacterium]
MKPFVWCPRCASALTDRPDGHRACPACDFVHWDNPVPVVAGIVETPAGVVLVQNRGWPSTWFGLVTGFLEKIEAPVDGIVREVKEELDLDAEPIAFIGLYPFAQANQIIMAWHLRADGPITPSDELAAFKVVPVQKLRPWPLATGEAVRDWLASRGGAE